MDIKSIKYLLMVVFVVFQGVACTTPDSLMQKSALRNTAKSGAAAKDLVAFVKASKNDDKLRYWAFRSLATFPEVPDAVIDDLGKIMLNSGESKDIRMWAAYTLGKFKRKEALPYFLEALENNPEAGVDYYVIEGITRQVDVLSGDRDLSLRLLAAMNTYLSHAKNEPPSIYNLLDEYVATLSTLVVAMDELLNKKYDKNATKTRTEDLYGASYRIFHTIERSLEQLLNNYAANQMSLEKAFDLTYKALETKYQPAFLLYAWYSGEIANNPELSILAAGKILPWLNNEDPELRQLVLWALMEMEVHNEDIRAKVLKHLATKETDHNTLLMLGDYKHKAGTPDVIQQLRGISVKDDQ